MPEPPTPGRRPANGGLAALAIGALGIGCCAGLPLIAALASSVAIGTLLGGAAGVIALTALAATVIAKTRARRRACATPTPSNSPPQTHAAGHGSAAGNGAAIKHPRGGHRDGRALTRRTPQ